MTAEPGTAFISICMITYNHEKYIAEAIEGVLSQESNFSFELIISNDASTDNTDGIINEIISNHSKGNLIKYFNHEGNLGMMPNFIFALNKCKGKYVAICEGDDYWTDPNKLQKQVNYLEAHEDYSICFHRVYELKDDKKPVLSNLNSSKKEKTYTVQDLARYNFIHTPSVVFRNGFITAFPEWFKESPVGDYVLHMLNARHGKIKYLPEAMAVYRLHTYGTWSTQSQVHRSARWVWMLAHLSKEFKDTDVEKILLSQKAQNELYISNAQKPTILYKIKLLRYMIGRWKEKLIKLFLVNE
jgi:glycosyltransferase involved in cell wall biosynthesis